MATSLIKQQKMVVDTLWTNPSPTSSFSGNRINCDYSNYRLLVLVFRQVYNANYMTSVVVPVDFIGAYVASTIRYDGSNNYNICRQFATTPAKDYIGMANGYRFNTYATGVEDNNILVPQKVYGIR